MELEPEVGVFGLRAHPLLRATHAFQPMKQPHDVLLDGGILFRTFPFGGESL